MRKQTKDLQKKTPEELQKEIDTTIGQIAQAELEQMTNPQKDTNSLAKKRKQIARLKTMLTAQVSNT